MLFIQTYNQNNKPSAVKRTELIDFLYAHLQEFGDEREAISKCMSYALSENGCKGGFIVEAVYETAPVGVLIINETGMDQYIPENILVYIATHSDHRGQGIGKALMAKAIENTEGSIALHVEPHNPAKALYEKLGFTNKYLEMRLVK
jgi:GNAT superfamily N-acetyltransferase